MPQFVAYYRVSTGGQGASGLGLDAQRLAVTNYVRGVGGQIIGSFEEVESGASSARPKLDEALNLAKSKKAMLVIAKLDRLARNVHFISELLESGVDFVAADMPHANKLTIHIIAAVAEYERDVIAKRTKAALGAAKARGRKLGNPRVSELSMAASLRAQQNADEFAKRIAPDLAWLQARGITSPSKIAAALNEKSVRTQRGRRWTPTGVSNVLLRANKLRLLGN